MPDPVLAQQLRGLLAEARPETVPGGRLARWGPASFRTPFDPVQLSAQNEIHLTLEPAVSAGLLAQIGTPTTAASNERKLSGVDLERS